jgi:hypothetical protein
MATDWKSLPTTQKFGQNSYINTTTGQRFLSAKDIPYKQPGAVAEFYGWNANNIDRKIGQFSGGSTKNDKAIMEGVTTFLGKRSASLGNASGDLKVQALDFAFREQGRRQQTKGSFLGDLVKGMIGAAIGVGVGFAFPALGPVLGGTLGGAAQGGVEDGWKGAVWGAVKGYSLGQTAAWGAGKLGITKVAPVVDKSITTTVGPQLAKGGYIPTAASGVGKASLLSQAASGVSTLNNLIGVAGVTAAPAVAIRTATTSNSSSAPRPSTPATKKQMLPAILSERSQMRIDSNRERLGKNEFARRGRMAALKRAA